MYFWTVKNVFTYLVFLRETFKFNDRTERLYNNSSLECTGERSNKN